MDGPPIKRALSSSDMLQPPPKKAACSESAAPSAQRTPSSVSQATEHSRLSVGMLQKQNMSLSRKLQQTQRTLADCEEQLRTAQSTTACRDNSLSIFDRQWAQLEAQLALVVSQLEGAPARPASDATSVSALLPRLSTPVASLVEDAAVDDALQARCARMQQLGAAIVEQAVDTSPLATPAHDGAAEEVALNGELALLRDRHSRAESSCNEMSARLTAANEQLDKVTKDLNRERLKREMETATAPPAAAGAAGKLEAAASSLEAGSGAAASAAVAAAEADTKAAREESQRLLTELHAAREEMARAQQAEQEIATRPVTEEQVRAHPVCDKLQLQVKQYREIAAEWMRSLEQVRADHLKDKHGFDEIRSRFEEYRIQQTQQASEEAKQHAASVAAALTERRTLELKIEQAAIAYQREEARAKELDARLRFSVQENTRFTNEAARFKDQLATYQKERDAARVAEQHERQAAHSTWLELECLRKAAPNGVVLEMSDTEKRYNESLVRLGGAEQKAAQASNELLKLQGAQKTLESEIEAVSATYEEVQSQNDELRQTISLKEDSLTRARSDKLRADQVVTTLKSELATLQERAEKLQAHVETARALRISFEAHVRKSDAAIHKKDEEINMYETVLTQLKAQVKDANTQVTHATKTRQEAQAAEAHFKSQLQQATSAVNTEQVKLRKAEAERDELNRRLTRMAAMAEGGKGGAWDSDKDEQLEYYRSKVKCTLCNKNDKDAIISKCMHSFCRECIDKRLAVRNRKCPACALQFDFQSVKDLYLTS